MGLSSGPNYRSQRLAQIRILDCSYHQISFTLSCRKVLRNCDCSQGSISIDTVYGAQADLRGNRKGGYDTTFKGPGRAPVSKDQVARSGSSSAASKESAAELCPIKPGIFPKTAEESNFRKLWPNDAHD